MLVTKLLSKLTLRNFQCHNTKLEVETKIIDRKLCVEFHELATFQQNIRQDLICYVRRLIT
jgi:hypothetical protein